MIIAISLTVALALCLTLILSGKHHVVKNTLVTVSIALFFSTTASVLILNQKFSDTEIWNGYVTNKTRHHDEYERSYQCNCRTDKDGYTSCDTCYEDRYTVTWKTHTTVGDITLEHLDSSWRSVYNKPDPDQYVKCKVGEPASRTNSYVNYIMGTPDSLYNDYEREFEEKIPTYPSVYNYYRINRVVGSVSNEKTEELNQYLNDALKTLGAEKQVNIVVVTTDVIDPMYKYALESKWVGGKMNDVVVILSPGEDGFIWTDAFTFANDYGNELFISMITRELNKIDGLDYQKAGEVIVDMIKKHYDRPSMADFEYLKSENDLKLWQILLIILIGGVATPIITYKIDN